MPERPSPQPEREHRRLFDLSTIAGIPVDGLEVSKDAQEIADAYLGAHSGRRMIRGLNGTRRVVQKIVIVPF